MNVLLDVVGNMCLMYVIVASSAVFDFRETAIKYDVSKHMKINAYLLPLDVVGKSCGINCTTCKWNLGHFEMHWPSISFIW